MPFKIVLMCLFLVSGCVAGQSGTLPAIADRGFFELTTDVQVERFQGFDMGRQFELIIVGNQQIHPPALYLVPIMAQSGKAAVPFLVDKLNATRDELTVRDIVSIYSSMQKIGSYDVRGDVTLMKLIEAKVAEINGLWKPVVVQMVDEIKGFK